MKTQIYTKPYISIYTQEAAIVIFNVILGSSKSLLPDEFLFLALLQGAHIKEGVGKLWIFMKMWSHDKVQMVVLRQFM